MNLSKIISYLLIIHIAFCGCDGFNWFGQFDIDDCNENDISIIQTLVLQSEETIEWDMDTDFNGQIEPLEVGWQFWEDGRLIHWICSDVPSPWYMYNYDCGLSGEFPKNLINLDNLEKLHFDNNNFSGEISTEICNFNIANKSDYWFRIGNNKLCPPFPNCIDGTNLIQDSSDCYEK
ncbi:MAG: hypothetical protein H8E72_05340 [Candidatus Marinimicrobia bacterium]|nr:hypothetical protein [Candidatus Neomarinimicrobiota bacterium]